MSHFHEFKRPDGSTVYVEYEYDGGSPTTYSPHSGASGGDPAEVSVIAVFDDNGDTELTDSEYERFEDLVLDYPPEYEPQDDDAF